VQDLDHNRARALTGKFFSPFDREHGVSCNFVQSEILDFANIREPIQIDMDEGDAAAAIFLHDRERRAVHHGRVEPEAFGKAPRKRRLACTEIAE
jgi:hypothetical protein